MSGLITNALSELSKRVDRLEMLEAKRSSELAAPSGSATDDQLLIAFVQGAQWWEWNKEKATMWSSDRDLAENEARVRLSRATLGKITLDGTK